MSNGTLHLLLVDSIDFKRCLGCQGSVTVTEGFHQLVCPCLRECFRIGHTDAPQILRLKPKIAAAHADTIGRDKELSDSRYQQPAQHLEVPDIRLNEIE